MSVEQLLWDFISIQCFWVSSSFRHGISSGSVVIFVSLLCWYRMACCNGGLEAGPVNSGGGTGTGLLTDEVAILKGKDGRDTGSKKGGETRIRSHWSLEAESISDPTFP